MVNASKTDSFAHPLPAFPAGSPFTSDHYKTTSAKFFSYADGPRPVRAGVGEKADTVLGLISGIRQHGSLCCDTACHVPTAFT